MMKRISYQSFLVAIWLLAWSDLSYALDNGRVFTDQIIGLNGFPRNLSAPVGIATDLEGNVFFHSDLNDPLNAFNSTTVVAKFSPDGQQLGGSIFGRGIPASQFIGSHLDRDPRNGVIYLLTPQGQLYSFDPKPNQLQLKFILDLAGVSGQTFSDVFDIGQQRFKPLILTGPNYGDFAVRPLANNRLELFIAGDTAAGGKFPFVMRVRLNTQTSKIEDIKPIVTSTGTLLGTGQGPPGIAVNSQGVVMTTMTDTSTSGKNALAVFGADFIDNKNNASLRPRFLFKSLSFSPGFLDTQSKGMTTDSSGNFYVATGLIGITACTNQGSGALLFVPNDLSTFECFPPIGSPVSLVGSQDVAVNSSGTRVYMTVTNQNLLSPTALVVEFRQAALPGNTSKGNNLDVDGDGKADLLWRNTKTGAVAVWLLNGTLRASSGLLNTVPTDWQVVGRGDMDGDGKSDVIWRRKSTGDVAVWLLNGLGTPTTGFPGRAPTEWVISGTGDLNGDGKADLVWRNINSGAVAVWFMNGTTRASADFPPGVPLQWQIAGMGDVDGDGKADVIWRQAANGAVAVWLMNGVNIRSGSFPGGAPSEWTIKGVGDVDGDGKADLVWKNETSKAVAIWLMNGGTRVSSGVINSLFPDWEFEQVGDTNGDGKVDVITRNTVTGAVGVWLLDGLKRNFETGVPGSFSTEWEIQK